MRLERWSVVTGTDPYLPPEMHGQYLNGLVYDHPEFQDGMQITTTQIVAAEGEDAVKTKTGRVYLLGDIDPKYEELYPNARQRLFSTLPKQGV